MLIVRYMQRRESYIQKHANSGDGDPANSEKVCGW